MCIDVLDDPIIKAIVAEIPLSVKTRAQMDFYIIKLGIILQLLGRIVYRAVCVIDRIPYNSIMPGKILQNRHIGFEVTVRIDICERFLHLYINPSTLRTKPLVP